MILGPFPILGWYSFYLFIYNILYFSYDLANLIQKKKKKDREKKKKKKRKTPTWVPELYITQLLVQTLVVIQC